MGEREDMRSEMSRPEEQDTRAAVPDEPNAAGVIEGCSGGGGEKRKMAGLGYGQCWRRVRKRMAYQTR
eukprot:scaffold12300_cov132-Isochrysis_galbana.AAC.17